MPGSRKPGETWRGHVSPAVKTAYNRRTYEAITFRVKLDGSDGFTGDQIRHAAEQCGQSVNAWILDAIRDKI